MNKSNGIWQFPEILACQGDHHHAFIDPLKIQFHRPFRFQQRVWPTDSQKPTQKFSKKLEVLSGHYLQIPFIPIPKKELYIRIFKSNNKKNIQSKTKNTWQTRLLIAFLEEPQISKRSLKKHLAYGRGLEMTDLTLKLGDIRCLEAIGGAYHHRGIYGKNCCLVIWGLFHTPWHKDPVIKGKLVGPKSVAFFNSKNWNLRTFWGKAIFVR